MQRQREELTRLLSQKPPSEEDVNALATDVLRSLYWMAVYFRCLADPVDPETGEYRDGTPCDGAYLEVTPAAVKPYLTHISGITVHTRIVGRGSGIRHEFLGGEIAFREAGDGTCNLNPHLPGWGRGSCR
jgi:hypothetical protein